MKRIHIKYFASIREALGTAQEDHTTSCDTLGQLRDELAGRNAASAQVLSRQRAVRMALNQVMSSDAQPLLEACEVAFFPPVTGG